MAEDRIPSPGDTWHRFIRCVDLRIHPNGYFIGYGTGC
jgi:hypothetical protein